VLFRSRPAVRRAAPDQTTRVITRDAPGYPPPGPPPPPLEAPPPDRTLWPWLLGLVLLVLGALLGYLLFHNSGHHKQRTVTRSAASERVVPGVVGRPQVEAARRVTKAGLVPRI